MQAQNCLPNGIELRTQSQIDSFAILYPDCSRIVGTVRIFDNPYSTTNKIQSLQGLSQLTSVGNSLTIGRTTQLQSLEGLENLSIIGLDLIIQKNEQLIDWSALNIKSVGRDIKILSNKAVDTLKGFDSLRIIPRNLNITNSVISLTFDLLDSINGDFYFSGSPFLIPPFQRMNRLKKIGGNFTSFQHHYTGLDSLLEIGGEFEVSWRAIDMSGMPLLRKVGALTVDNCAIENFIGLDSLEVITGDFIVINNDNLQSFSGLDNLQSTQFFEVRNNNIFVDFSGLSGLLTVADLNVVSNQLFENFAGMPNLKDVGTLTVKANPSLVNFLGFPSGVDSATLVISSNSGLESLEGVGSVDSIFALTLFNNNNLLSLQTTEGIRIKNHGTITIDGNDNISSLQGLFCPKDLATVLVRDNDNLQSLQGLNNAKTIEELAIRLGASLHHLVGLDSLQRITDIFTVENTYLTSFQGLDQLRLCKKIVVKQNGLLEDFEGFEQLEEVESYFWINQNASLLNLHGLNGLNTVRQLHILNNNFLESLIGLEGLNTVRKDIRIESNASLESLSGIQNIDPSGFEGAISNRMTFNNNSSLSECAISSVCETIADPDLWVIIQGNANGCGSVSQVENECISNPPGCQDSTAHNYNPDATQDDNSCQTCDDGILNGDETDIDCGGVLCGPCIIYGADCPQALNLTGLPIVGGYYQAADTLLADNIVPANIGPINFSSGQVIDLHQSFEIPLGVEFEAIIQPCVPQ